MTCHDGNSSRLWSLNGVLMATELGEVAVVPYYYYFLALSYLR